VLQGVGGLGRHARLTGQKEENYFRVNAASLGRFSGSSVSAVCSLCRLAGKNPAAFWQYLLLRTSFSSSSLTILQLITSNTFFLVLDQVFSLFLFKK
jgi:hypothetical protein